MKALSPAPVPPMFDRINRWNGWGGLALSAGILLAAAGVLVATAQIKLPEFDPAPAAAAAGPTSREIVEPKALSLDRQGIGPAPAVLDSVLLGEVDGRPVLKIRVNPRGPTVLLDARTGEVVEQLPAKPEDQQPLARAVTVS